MKTNLFKSLLATFMIVVSTNVAYGDTYNYNEAELTATLTHLDVGVNSKREVEKQVTYNKKTYTVTGIASHAIQDSRYLTELVIPNTIKFIGQFAIYHCPVLEKVTLPSEEVTIEMCNFLSCEKLPVINGIRYADTYLVEVVDSCKSNASFTIKEDTRWIGNNAFKNCTNLTDITIPDNVISMYNNLFEDCNNLKNVNLLSEVPAEIILNGTFGTFGDSTDTYNINVPCGTLEAYKTAWSSYESRIQYKSLPYQINGSVNDSTMGSIYVPIDICDSTPLSAIPNNGYEFVRWSDGNTENPRIIELTQDTTLVAEFAKTRYITLESDSIMGKIIGKNTAFDGEVVTLDVMPNYGYRFIQWSDGITETPRDFTITCDTTIIAEFEVEKSGTCGHNNSLTWEYDDQTRSLYISGNGALNENYTFGVEAPNVMEHIIIEEGVTSIGNKAFCNICSNVRSLSIANTITTIGDSAFVGIYTQSLVLPHTLIEIGEYAFANAINLRNIHFGTKLNEIKEYAFNNCTRVREMTCAAEYAPYAYNTSLSSIPSGAKLYVLPTSIEDYSIDPEWGRFDIRTLGSTETTTDGSVRVVPSDNAALVAWPVSDNAANYTIEITKDGVVFCTLIFNANGQLTGIAFAPSKDGSRHAPAAIMTANGMQFTVTGLNSGTNYAFSLMAKDAQNTVVASYTGQFTTTGGAPVATSLDDVQTDNMQCTKLLRDGQILIQRGEKTYTLQGQEVK